MSADVIKYQQLFFICNILRTEDLINSYLHFTPKKSEIVLKVEQQCENYQLPKVHLTRYYQAVNV